MDSKTLLKTCAFVISGILVVILIVLLVNKEPDKNGTEQPSTTVSKQVVKDERKETKTKDGVQVGDDLNAFETQAGFFDGDSIKEKEAKKKKEDEEESRYLSMLITSVQRDMRIQVLDHEGKLVVGQDLYVSIENVGEFKDLDQNGVIYVADLSPGNYQVTLKPVEGYRVSAFALNVSVKSQLDYEAISDISLLIKHESEIDAKAEDTMENEAIKDADDTEITDSLISEGTTRFGIDVSKYNGEIDWKAAKEDGVEFAIVRCGYRGSKSGVLVEDPCFEANMKNAARAGVSTGIYFFSQATTEVEAVEEASMCLALTKEYDLTYPIYIDSESAGGDGRADALTREERTKITRAFIETIRNNGKEAGVYASRNWFNKNLDVSQLEDYVIWLAEYRSAPVYPGKYQMWQYTSKGHVSGIEGNVDLDFSYLGLQ